MVFASGGDKATEPMQTLQAMQVQQMAERRLTDMMADAGVDSSRMSQEVLWFLPRDFVNAYSEIFYAAFAGKDDGGTGARGRAVAEEVAVGRASGKGLQGLGGAKRKTYKKYWVIADENAVSIKENADKRLRALARDMRRGLEQDGQVNEGLPTCGGCRRFIEAAWKFCPNCGEGLSRSE